MERTVAIITSEESFDNNYGAVLQGYALFRFISDCGMNPFIIRYKGGEFSFASKFGVLKRAKAKLLEKQSVGKKTEKTVDFQNRKKLFVDFQRERLSFWNDHRMNWHQLQKKYPLADYYVCGSDQIWNPYFKGEKNDPGYFLKFVPQGSKKIAYAPSFGCDDLPADARGNLEELLQDFSAISVREKSGVEIVEKYAQRTAKFVLDPTMLLLPESWKEIARLPAGLPAKYILCYRFADSKKTKMMIDRISSETGLPVISLPLSEVALNDEYKQIFEAGPREFIGLIQHAALVCTDSFHATVFSILMKTPVCVFLREAYQNGGSMNSRIFSLLEMLSLQDLMIRESDAVEKALNCMTINYENAHRHLSVYRSESRDFLREALK